jgi:hypothetical protein
MSHYKPVQWLKKLIPLHELRHHNIYKKIYSGNLSSVALKQAFHRAAAALVPGFLEKLKPYTSHEALRFSIERLFTKMAPRASSAIKLPLPVMF